jgi:hypothetical protein
MLLMVSVGLRVLVVGCRSSCYSGIAIGFIGDTTRVTYSSTAASFFTSHLRQEDWIQQHDLQRG